MSRTRLLRFARKDGKKKFQQPVKKCASRIKDIEEEEEEDVTGEKK
jgi:hypothetical protein